MKVPEHYWPDVNGYCGAILTGLPVERASNGLLSQEYIGYEWPAQEKGFDAVLSRLTYRALGVVVNIQHCLAVARVESDTWVMGHFIRFDPVQSVMKFVQDAAPSIDGKETISEVIKGWQERRKRAKKTAILKPTDADYALLHDELQLGARFRSSRG